MLEYELILIKEMHQESVIYVIIGILLDKNFNYEPYFCNRCHDLMQKAINFNDNAIVSIKGNYYRIYFCYISNNYEISKMNNSNLNEKTGPL